VQEDHTNPLPCTPDEAAIWGATGRGQPPSLEPSSNNEPPPPAETSDDELFQQMLGGNADAGPKADAGAKPKPELTDDDELFRQMLGDAAPP
jgi:hypothetical protein